MRIERDVRLWRSLVLLCCWAATFGVGSASAERDEVDPRELVSVEVIGPERIKREEPVDYRVMARNRTETRLVDVAIEALIPEGFTILETDPTGRMEDGRVVWSVPAIKGSGEVEFQLTVQAGAAGTGRIEARVTRADRLLEDVAGPIALQEPPAPLPAPEATARVSLRLETPDRTIVDRPFACVAIISNSSDADVENLGFSMNLTEGLELRQSPDAAKGPLKVAAGQEERVTLELIARRPGTHGVRVRIDTGAGGVQTAQSEITVGDAELSVRLETPREQVMGTPLRFRMYIANNRNEPINDVQGFIELPEGIETVSAEAGALLNRRTRVIRWRVGTLAADEERGFRVTVRPTSATTLQFLARAQSAGGMSSQAEQTVSVLGHTALGVSFEPSLDLAPMGEKLTLTVDVRSRGSDRASDIVVKIQALDGLELVSDTSSEWTSEDGWWIYRAPHGLKAGETLQAALIVRPTKAGDYMLRAVVTSQETVGEIIRTQPVRVVEAKPLPPLTPAPGT